MNVLVIGCGSAGRRHIANMHALGCQVFGFDPSVTARAHVRSTLPFVQLLDSVTTLGMYHACVIATPADSHLYWVDFARRHNTPFFVEKPLGTLEELPHWRALADSTLPINQVGYNLRFHPVARVLKSLFVRPASAHFYCACNRSIWPGHRYGSTLLELSHEIDLAHWIGGGSLTVAHAAISEDGDIQIWFNVSGDERSRWQVCLNDQATGYHRQWTLHDAQGCMMTWHFQDPDQLGTEMYRAELEHFLDCVSHRRATSCDLSEGLAVLEFCAQADQMMRSAA